MKYVGKSENLLEENKEVRQALKEYATEIEMRELINRKVMKLRCDLVYGAEKRKDKSFKEYENKHLNFDYFNL
jgi:hypothetical protein